MEIGTEGSNLLRMNPSATVVYRREKKSAEDSSLMDESLLTCVNFQRR